MLYTAQHLSMACLEILVHLDKSELPLDYVWSWDTICRTFRNVCSLDDLNHVSSCQAAGNAWVRTEGELAVQVPSVVIPAESNFLLNPTHEGSKLVWGEPRPFRFDPRLFASEPRTL